MRARLPLLAFLVVVPALAALAACGDALGLPAPHLVNVVDTVSLYALDGTPLETPSAFQLDGRRRIRTDQTAVFDFAFNLDSAKHALILSTGALHLGQASGLQRSTTPFDRITEAPTGGWDFTTGLVVDTGTVALVRSRLALCSFGITVPFYAKLRVIAVDTVARRIDLQMLVDENCGYRGLAPGLPKL